MKELAIIVLSKIFGSVNQYQTLVREIATPNIPAFATACLQLMKAPSLGQAPAAPFVVVESICDAFSTLIPLYPATFRPFSSKIKSAIKGYLAPTISDDVLVPEPLQRAARKLAITLPCVAAKSGGSEEWANLVDGILRDIHLTADQILRAVDESWEGSAGYGRGRVGPDGELCGGGDAADQLPLWSGLTAGAERLMGLFAYLADCLMHPTKAPVTIPVGALLDAVSRICLVARQAPKSQTWDQAVATNASIGREEKDELWSCIPDLHISALELVNAMLRRFGPGTLPLIPEALDHLVRVFKSGIGNPAVRNTAYGLLEAILLLSGPTMSKATVLMLDPIIAACCRDLQEHSGFLKPVVKPSSSNKDGKKNGVANADLFLQPQASAVVKVTMQLEASHKVTADNLLTVLLSSLPQSHLKPTLRGLVDKTAIITRNRDAMISSVLNPYKDQRGRMYPSILPHLSQQYPQDQGLEILRSNLRTATVSGSSDMIASVAEVEQEEEDDDDEEMADDEPPVDEHIDDTVQDVGQPGLLPSIPSATVNLPIQSNPFESTSGNHPSAFQVGSAGDSFSKRKHEDAESVPSKRQEVAKSVAELPKPIPASTTSVANDAAEHDDDDDDEESVHLNMELEEDDDEEDEE